MIGSRVFQPTTLTAMLALLLGWATAGGDEPRETPIVKAIAKARGAVVNLRTLKTVPARVDQDGAGRVRGLGSGVLIDPRGYVVTNYHVVDKVQDIRAIMNDGAEFPVRLVNYDAKADLAVLKVIGPAGHRFHYLPLWGAGEPILGETVIAIGNPMGLEGTVCRGIVSNTKREMKLPNGEIYSDLIQTDAPINPGNSGGPLLNINGDLLGINSAIRSNAQGIAFAIPARKVERIVESIMGRPPIGLARLGLRTEERPGDAKRPGGGSVVTVSYVEPAGPAEGGGIKLGDELRRVDGQEVRRDFDLQRVLWERRFGDQIKLSIKSGGDEKEATIALKAPKRLSEEEVIWERVGVWATPVSAQRVQSVYSEFKGGLLLLAIAPGSPAASAGWKPGDILVGLHTWSMEELSHVRFVMESKEVATQASIVWTIIRDGRLLEPPGKIQLPTYP